MVVGASFVHGLDKNLIFVCFAVTLNVFLFYCLTFEPTTVESVRA